MLKTKVNIECFGGKVECKDLVNQTKLIWKEQGGKIKDIQTLELYYKPEENMCYYVVNTTETGSFSVEGI